MDLAEFKELPPFVNPSFHPSTGLGHFETEINQAKGTLNVTVRADIKWHDNPNSDMHWTEPDKKAWLAGLIYVEKEWSENFVFKCTKKGWEKLVLKPTFKLIASKEDPHYALCAVPYPGTDNTAVRRDDTASFCKDANNRLANAAFHLKSIETDFATPFYVPVDKVISFESLFVLECFAWTGVQAFGAQGQSVKLVLTGFGDKDEKANKANAEKVKKLLQTFELEVKYVIASGMRPEIEYPFAKKMPSTWIGDTGEVKKGVHVAWDMADYAAKFP
jgi:hypothetical protein